MALISAAVAAISAAIATTTIATVSAAVVAVANVIAVAGLAVTAVGAITGNADLMKAGKIMGYVGMAGNVAGWGVGSLAEGAGNFASRIGSLYTEAWDKGVGNLFSAAKQPATVGSATLQPATVQSPAGLGGSTAQGATPAANGAPAATVAEAGTPVVQSPGAPASPGGTQPGTVTPGSVAPPQTPTASSVTGGNAPAGAPPTTGGTPPPTDPGYLKGLLNNPLLPLTAAQGLGGAAGGWFTASATEQQTELQNRIDARNALQQRLTNENNSYVPLIDFTGPGGLLNRGRT